MQTNCKNCTVPYTFITYWPEHPCYFDGISELHCNTCGSRTGRWSGKLLKKGEHEPVLGMDHGSGCADKLK